MNEYLEGETTTFEDLQKALEVGTWIKGDGCYWFSSPTFCGVSIPFPDEIITKEGK